MTDLEADMVQVFEQIMEEFDDRYDGAPDAKMQWMGHLMHEIQRVLNRARTL